MDGLAPSYSQTKHIYNFSKDSVAKFAIVVALKGPRCSKNCDEVNLASFPKFLLRIGATVR
jgi:hypothetical protein